MKKKIFIRNVLAVIVAMLLMTVTSINVSGQLSNVQIVGVQQVIDATQNPPFLSPLSVTILSQIPLGTNPQFFNIYAQIPGNNNFAWVAMNIYLDSFPNPRILNRSISLQQLGIPDNVRIPNINLFFWQSNNAVIAPVNPGFFIPFSCPLDSFFVYDNVIPDTPGLGGGIAYTPIDFAGPIQASVVRSCNVPNVDLDNGAHPAGGTYAGDLNACAPASVANSLSWIQGANPLVGSDGLSERERLEELSGLMGRAAGGGATQEQIIQAKISFISNHGLKLKVEYLHASGNYEEDKKWLKDQYDAGQDIEIDYSYPTSEGTKSHAVVLTDLKITGTVPQISFKDDTDQNRSNGAKEKEGTVETTLELREGDDGHITFTRDGVVCTVNNIYAESYDENAGTYTDPKTGTSSTVFCQKNRKHCSGACPALISFYDGNQLPVITYPVCDPKNCCDIHNVYTIASGTCQEKKGKCRGTCAPIYRSKSDAAKGSNPIQGKCNESSGCKCQYDLTKKFKRLGSQLAEELAEGKLAIFPNPAMNQINIAVDPYIGMVQFKVINTLGQELLVNSAELKGEDLFTLDITILPAGIYKLVMKNDTDVSTGTFVKEQ